MNLEDLKKKAAELKNDLEPKVKETAQKAGKAVSEFVDEHIKPNQDNSETSETGANAASQDSEAVHVEAETDDSHLDETLADKINNKFGKKKNSRKKAKTVKFKEEPAAGETVSENADSEDKNSKTETEAESKTDTETTSDTVTSDTETAETSGTTDNISKEETTEQENQTETVNGEVVGTVKDRYNQFVTNVMPKVMDTASNVGEKVKDVAVTAGGKVKDVSVSAGEKVKDVAVTVGGKVKDTFQEIAPKAKENIENLGPKIKEGAQDLGPRVKKTFGEVGPKVYNGAKKTGETISFQGYRIRKTLGKKLKRAVKKKLGFSVGDGKSDGIKYYEVRRKKASKFIMHLRTVRAHRKMVLKHCIKAGIPVQGLLHDLSKYSPSEFYYGVKFFRGDRSPNEGEREDHGFSYAWMHHKGRNKHHFEYWNDYNIQANKALPVKMPLKYVIEMFCDRVAASKVYLKGKYTNLCPYDYFDKGRSRRTIHQETSDFLEKLLKMLANKGEEYTFLYIRWYMKHHKDY